MRNTFALIRHNLAMQVAIAIILLISAHSIHSNLTDSFDLSLNIGGDIHHFSFIETAPGTRPVPSVYILNGEENPIPSDLSLSSLHTYQVKSDEYRSDFATVIGEPSTDSSFLFAMVQISNGSWYDISPSISMIKPRQKRSSQTEYFVRHRNRIIENAFVSIAWSRHRNRRDIDEAETVSTLETTEITRLPASEEDVSYTLPSATLPNAMEDITLPAAENDTGAIWNLTMATSESTTTTKRPIPVKTRHLYFEIVAAVDSLIVTDVRTLLNRTELETIEILKLYYLHVFMGVEKLYQQSLIYETLDVHIRLKKLIFATDKHRLPWELFKNISSLTNAYRKMPNHMDLRPNISMNLLTSLHHAYTIDKFDSKYSIDEADHIMTFTRIDLENGAGSAYVLGACLPAYRYSIVQEDLNAFPMMITASHELGHNLGLNHDETENQCNEPTVRYIMSPKNMDSPDRRQLPYFSPCSIKQLNDFADTTTTTCWKNPIVSTRNDSQYDDFRQIISNKLGQIINIHQQCQLQYGSTAVPFVSVTYDRNQSLYEENLCNQLRCFKKPEDEYMYWQDGALEGTVCGENRICQGKECVTANETTKLNDSLTHCPYGDLFVPIPMMNFLDLTDRGHMLCPNALNLLRSRGINVTHLCYASNLPYERLCCEECKKHRLPQCGDRITRCPSFSQYCGMEYMRINGVPMNEMCPYTCGQCTDLPPPTTTTTTVSTTTKKTASKKKMVVTTTKKMKLTTPKPRKYVKPKSFDEQTCIDSADCSQLIKLYSRAKKSVENWCTEYSTMIQGRYFAERCPKYCSLCNITSKCDEYRLCQNNGTCIKDEHGTYQCLCSKFYYGTLCEYRRTCLDNPCPSPKEFCIQMQGEDYLCLSKEDKEQLRTILDGKKLAG